MNKESMIKEAYIEAFKDEFAKLASENDLGSLSDDQMEKLAQYMNESFFGTAVRHTIEGMESLGASITKRLGIKQYVKPKPFELSKADREWLHTSAYKNQPKNILKFRKSQAPQRPVKTITPDLVPFKR